jgi:DNA-binding MarR family transcriptional regulator
MNAPSGRKVPGGPPGGPRLGYLLRQAAGAHRLAMERALSDLDVTPPQFLVLRLLAETPGSSSADIARAASLTTATMSVIVTNLKRREAVASTAHAVHGRIQQLSLTETGRGLLRACGARVAGVEAELQAGLSADEAERIAAWLRRATSGGS